MMTDAEAQVIMLSVMRYTDADVQALARHLATCAVCRPDKACPSGQPLLSVVVKRLADEIDDRIAREVYDRFR